MLPEIIENSEDFNSLINQAMNSQYIAIDTEFIWELTYYPIPAIIQIGFSSQECYIVDYTRIEDFSIFGEVLENSNIEKILHDATQDLSILVRITGSSPCNVFDTQKAAGFIGLSSSISLSNLLKHALGIHLSKTETRTNWLKRPLSKRQIEYALNDVRYLPRLRNTIIKKVNRNGHRNWLFEEQKMYDNPELYKDKDAYSRLYKIKGIKQLTSKELAILFELVDWREKEAQEINVPREHIISDKTLILLAKLKSKKVKKITNSKDFTEKKNRLYGKKIIKAINKALNMPTVQWPEKSYTFRDDDTLNARIDFIAACIKGKCIANEIDPALIASRMEISEFVKGFYENNFISSQLTHGWRKKFIGDIIKNVLSGKHSVCLNPTTGLPQINNNDTSKKIR